MARKSSEMKEASVHEVHVGKLSSVKDSCTTVSVRYFKGQLSNGKKTVRIVSFEPKLNP